MPNFANIPDLIRVSPTAFACHLEGKVFGKYIEDWDFGFDAGDIIDLPAMVVFSLIYEYALTEKYLKVLEVDLTRVSEGLYGYKLDLQVSQDDFYNDAYVTAISTSDQYDLDEKILDYDGTNKIIYVASSAEARMVIGDYAKVYGIKAKDYIDEVSFKAIGAKVQNIVPVNSFSLNVQNNFYDILNGFLIENRLLLVKSGLLYKIKEIDSTDILFTFQFPLRDSNSRDQISWSSVNNSQLVTELNVASWFDYLEGDFRNIYSYDTENAPEETSAVNEDIQSYLANARSIRKTANLANLQYKTIREDTILGSMLKSFTAWNCTQLLRCSIVTDIANHIQIEKGDIVYIYHKLIPSNLNADRRFLVLSKEIVPDVYNPHCKFSLIEQPNIYDVNDIYIDSEDSEHFETEDSTKIKKE